MVRLNVGSARAHGRLLPAWWSAAAARPQRGVHRRRPALRLRDLLGVEGLRHRLSESVHAELAGTWVRDDYLPRSHAHGFLDHFETPSLMSPIACTAAR